MTKYHIEKNTVQETLIIPLYGRKVCSEKFPHLFKDPEAERICDRLDYDFSEKGRKMESSVAMLRVLNKLEILNNFETNALVSPLLIAKQEGKTPKRIRSRHD